MYICFVAMHTLRGCLVAIDRFLILHHATALCPTITMSRSSENTWQNGLTKISAQKLVSA